MTSDSSEPFDGGRSKTALAVGCGAKCLKWRGGWITDQDIEGLVLAFKIVAGAPVAISYKDGDMLYRLFRPLFARGGDKEYLASSRHGLRTEDHLKRLLRATVDRSEVQLMKAAVNIWIALRFHVEDEDELLSMHRELHDLLVQSGQIEAIFG